MIGAARSLDSRLASEIVNGRPCDEPVYKNLKVAWLGSQDGAATNPTGEVEEVGDRMFQHLSSLFEDCDHHFYDIANKVSWDANEEWGIEGFDLVLNFRLNILIKSSTHLLEQLRKTVENNKLVITDFISGNATITANAITLSWKKLDNLIAFFPEYYTDYYALHPWARDKAFHYKVRDDEQLVTKEKLAAHSLTLEGVHSFVDSIKKRHYILAMVKGC
jgi:hypothetical protein